MAWPPSVLVWINDVEFIGFLERVAPLDSHQEIPVSLVDVDDSEFVNLVISNLLEYHDVGDLFPSREYVTTADTEIHDGYDD